MFSDGPATNRTSDADPPGHDWWSDTPREQLTRGGHRVVSLFLGSIMVSGFFNNLLVLVLFCRFKTLRTPINMLLLNISVSDMLVCACGTTLSFASSLRSRWLFGRLGCLWYGFINSCFGECRRRRTWRKSSTQTLYLRVEVDTCVKSIYQKMNKTQIRWWGRAHGRRRTRRRRGGQED